MPAVRPLSALRPALLDMATAAQKANTAVVRHATVGLGSEVSRRGRRYTLRGRGGRQVPLTAATDIKTFGGDPVGRVRGVPEGFWAIIQYGAGPHIIARNVTRAGRRQSIKTTTRRAASGQSTGALQPIRTPYGPRQFVRHRGHGPVGHPWDGAMLEAPRIVGDALQEEQTRQLVAAFVGR